MPFGVVSGVELSMGVLVRFKIEVGLSRMYTNITVNSRKMAIPAVPTAMTLLALIGILSAQSMNRLLISVRRAIRVICYSSTRRVPWA